MSDHLQPAQPVYLEYTLTPQPSIKVLDIKVDLPSPLDLQRRFNHIIRDNHNQEEARRTDEEEEECASLDRKARYLTQVLECRLGRLEALRAIAHDPLQGLGQLRETQLGHAQVCR